MVAVMMMVLGTAVMMVEERRAGVIPACRTRRRKPVKVSCVAAGALLVVHTLHTYAEQASHLVSC